jgi:ABC-type uncharacterized transport system involved in gliding motility auxiliary subunit
MHSLVLAQIETKGPWGVLQDQMKMVKHQAVGMHLPPGLLTSFTQRVDKPLSILVILENLLTPIPTVHHVVDRTLILGSHLSRHAEPSPLWTNM